MIRDDISRVISWASLFLLVVWLVVMVVLEVVNL